MSDCKVSVIIPVHNCEQFLRQCIDSVLSQTLSEIEVILINDASTDSSQVIIDEYLANDDRIQVVQLENNKGVSVARNTGIDKSTGQYLIFVDADDYWIDQRMLENLYAKSILEQADLTSFGFCRVDEAGKQKDISVEAAAVVNPRQQKNWSIKYNAWAKFISRKYLSEHEIAFKPSLIMGEDALFSITLYCNANKLVVMDDVYYCYRTNPYGVNHAPWTSTKIFDSLRWFEMAIPIVRGSLLFEFRPDILQSITMERFKMLCTKLGPKAMELLTARQRQDYFERWVKCLDHLDPAYFNKHFQADSDAEVLREMMVQVRQNDVVGLSHSFNNDTARRQRTGNNIQSVTLSKQQAYQLGQDLLQVNKTHIRCEMGSNVIITLPREEAYQLARRLIANREPEITLRFN